MLCFVTALLLGLASVLQAGLNRRVAGQFDLPTALVLNNSVLLAASLAIFCGAARGNAAASLLRVGEALVARPSLVVPGLLGIALVGGIPWAIGRWGAASVFVSLIASQLLAGAAWDAWVERRPVSRAQVAGIALGLAGAWLAGLGAAD